MSEKDEEVTAKLERLRIHHAQQRVLSELHNLKIYLGVEPTTHPEVQALCRAQQERLQRLWQEYLDSPGVDTAHVVGILAQDSELIKVLGIQFRQITSIPADKKPNTPTADEMIWPNACG